MSDDLLFEVKDKVAVMTLNRPEALNALHMTVVRSSEDHQEAVAAFKDKRQPNFKGR